jgi:ferritin
MLQVEQDRKSAVNKLKAFVNTKKQWDGFCEYLDILISEQHRKLEKADNIVSVHRAQGAVEALRYLKYLREEASD